MLLEVVRVAAPCKLLDDTIGRGAQEALRRRGGSVCRVLEGGEIAVGDPVDLDAGPGGERAVAPTTVPSTGSTAPLMPRLHALELVPDDAGDAAVRRDWQALRDAGLPSQLDHPAPRTPRTSPCSRCPS